MKNDTSQNTKETFDRLIDEIRIKDSVINEVKNALARADVGEMTTTGGIQHLAAKAKLLDQVKEVVLNCVERPNEANETLIKLFKMLEDK